MLNTATSANLHFLHQRTLLLKLASLLIIIPSALVLYGWLIEERTLYWLFPNHISMKANTALGFILASLALYLFNTSANWVYQLQRAIAVVLFTLGGITIYQYASNTTLPYVDQLLVKSSILASGVSAQEPSLLGYRMSPLAAINLMLVANTIFMLSNRYSNRQLNVARLFVIPVIVSSILVLIGYAYGVRDLYRFGFFVPISPLSAISFLLLATSLLFIRAERGFMRLFVGKTLGSRMVRWLVPVLVITFIGIGWLCRRGTLQHLYNDQFEISLLIFFTLLLSNLLIIWQARIQHGQELLRQHAQHVLEKNNQALERKVRQRTQELEKLMRDMEAISLTDGLTGIANRRALEQRLLLEWQRASRYQHPLSVLMLDIDYFKRLNDEFGHDAGDETLRQVAQLLTESARETDMVCRFGGEEFMLIMIETGLADAVQVAERMRAYVATHAWDLRPVTISIGVATLHADEALKTLLKHADQALYQAKAAGRNCVIAAE